METLIQEYYELVQLDKKLEQKYISTICNDELRESVNKLLDSFCIWKKINNIEDIANILSSKDLEELLRIEDFYADLVGEIYEIDYNKSFLDSIEDKNNEGLVFSSKNYLRILNNKKSSQLLKDCIEILLKAAPICSELYNKVIKGRCEKN